MELSRARIARTWPPASYARGSTRHRVRRRPSRPDRRREPERFIALEPDLRDRCWHRGNGFGPDSSGKGDGLRNQLLAPCPFVHRIQKPGTTDPNGHAIGDPLGDREVRGAELALDGKPGARLDGYQMLWVWTRGCESSVVTGPAGHSMSQV